MRPQNTTVPAWERSASCGSAADLSSLDLGRVIRRFLHLRGRHKCHKPRVTADRQVAGRAKCDSGGRAAPAAAELAAPTPVEPAGTCSVYGTSHQSRDLSKGKILADADQ